MVFKYSMKFLDSQEEAFCFVFIANTLSQNLDTSWFQWQHNKHIWYFFVMPWNVLSKSIESTAVWEWTVFELPLMYKVDN